MVVLKFVNTEDMRITMNNDAQKKFTACNPEKCPRCRISDG